MRESHENDGGSEAIQESSTVVRKEAFVRSFLIRFESHDHNTMFRHKGSKKYALLSKTLSFMEDSAKAMVNGLPAEAVRYLTIYVFLLSCTVQVFSHKD